MPHFGFFPLIPIILLTLLIGLLISNIIIFRRRGICFRESRSAIEMLDLRLASGEIELEQYQKIKEKLKG